MPRGRPLPQRPVRADGLRRAARSPPGLEPPLRREEAARRRPRRAASGWVCGDGGTAGPADPRPAAGEGSTRPAAPNPAAAAACCSQQPRRQPLAAAAASPPGLLGSVLAPGLAPSPNSSSGSDRKHDLIIVLARAQHPPPRPLARPPRFPPLARRPVNS